MKKDLAGPGTYEMPNLLGKSQTSFSEFKNMPSYSMGKARRNCTHSLNRAQNKKHMGNASPNVTAYTPHFEKVQQQQPSFSIGRDSRFK